MKRTKHDAIFSDLVRIRSLACERCGRGYTNFPDERDASFQCSHFYGRKYNSTRYDPDNCFALCASCHSELEDAPAEHSLWVRSQLGEVRYDELRVRWRRICRRRKHDLEEMYEHLKAEWERLLKLRRDGVTGRIEFTGYE